MHKTKTLKHIYGMLNQLYMWLTTLSQYLFYLRMMELPPPKKKNDSERVYVCIIQLVES